jgi:iron complex outermembrane receptor protein
MEDKGIEFSINADLIRSTDIAWTAGFNATLNRNKITNLTAVTTPNFPGLPVGGISGGIGTTIQIDQVGYAKNSFYTLQQVYGANGKPLDGVFVDRNKDGIINSQDLAVNQSPDPQEYLGLNSNFRYKKWDIGFAARATFGNYVYNNVASSSGFKSNFLNPITLFNGSSSVLNSGFSGLNSSNEYLSDYYLENASFLKLDNVHLGYNLGKLLGGGTVLRVNASVQNVFIVTKYTGLDPEVTNGIDNNLYPRPRTYLLGLSLSL